MDYSASFDDFDNMEKYESMFENIVESNKTVITKDVPKCKVCGSKNFTTCEEMIVCITCNTIIEERFSDKITWKSGESRELNDCSSTVSRIMPEISTKTYISGRCSRALKQLHQWNSSSYSEKVNKKIYDDLCILYANYVKLKAKERYARDHNIPIKNVPENKLIIPLINKEIIEDTVMKYKAINNTKISRFPIRDGVIAKCFYYACKDRYIIMHNQDLTKMWNIKNDVISRGNNKLNKQLKANKKIWSQFNKRPIKLTDYIYNLRGIFPKLLEEHVAIIKRIIYRIIDNRIVLKNTPRAILSGILNNCIRIYKFPITYLDIKDELYISISTINKYTKSLEPLIYRK